MLVATVTPAGTVQLQFRSEVVVVKVSVVNPSSDEVVGAQVVEADADVDVAVIVVEVLANPLRDVVTVTVDEVPAFKPETTTGMVPDTVLRFPIVTTPRVAVAEYVFRAT